MGLLMSNVIRLKITFTKPINSSTQYTLKADPNIILASILTLFKNRVRRHVEDMYINGCVGYEYSIDPESLECVSEERFKLIYPYDEGSSDSKQSLGIRTDCEASSFIIGLVFEDNKKMNLCKINGTLKSVVNSISSINKKSPPSWGIVEKIEYIY